MLTYQDLRREKKGISLYLLEIGITLGVILYTYFFDLQLPFFNRLLSDIITGDTWIYFLIGLFIYTLLSYFIFYNRSLGFIFQFLASFPAGLILADISSMHLILSISICAAIYYFFYYFQIMRPVRLSEDEYYANQEANGVTQYKYLGTIPNGQRKMNRLLSYYDSLNNKAMHIFSHMRTSGDTYPKQFTFISKEILSIKKTILSDLEELCEAEDELFEEIYEEIQISLDELDSDVASLHTLFTLHLSNASTQTREKTFSSDPPEEEESPPIPGSEQEAFDFFLGCEDLAKLKKRYRDLMKAYHSDGIAGNEEIATMINTAYENVKKRLS